MKIISCYSIIFIACYLVTVPIWAQQTGEQCPEFEFDVWGRPPSSKVYALTKERVVQKLLYSIKEKAYDINHIAAYVEEPDSVVIQKIKQLEEFNLVSKKSGKWISNIPLYTADEIRQAEKLGLRYAETEADILRDEIPKLKELYQKTSLSKYFDWDEVSLIIAGAFASDLCVVDRVPFKAGNINEELQPQLKTSEGRKWGYDGFEKLAKRFPSRKWKFYHNVLRKYSGGLAMFGYFRTLDEQRKSPPKQANRWLADLRGKIILALAETPLTKEVLALQIGGSKEIMDKKLQEMMSYNPPAVVYSDNRYQTKIPILTEGDLSLLLPICDKIAELIFQNVVIPHLEERKSTAQKLGYRWPLPADTYVRDKALQMLVEENLLSSVQPPPVDWNFGIWGWQGFLPMHDQITDNIAPDPFLKTPISAEEQHELNEANGIVERIIKGEKYLDISTPVGAFLTLMSGFVNSDIKALKVVHAPSDKINEGYLQQGENRGRSEFLKKVYIRRLPHLISEIPNENDVSPVFVTHEEGYDMTFVFFYYQGGWKFLFNNRLGDGLWQTYVQTELQAKWDELLMQ